MCRKLFMTQYFAHLVVRVGGVRRTEIHRHIHIMHTCSETGIKNWLIQSRVTSVHYKVGATLLDQGHYVALATSIKLHCVETLCVSEFFNCSLGRLE